MAGTRRTARAFLQDHVTAGPRARRATCSSGGQVARQWEVSKRDRRHMGRQSRQPATQRCVVARRRDSSRQRPEAAQTCPAQRQGPRRNGARRRPLRARRARRRVRLPGRRRDEQRPADDVLRRPNAPPARLLLRRRPTVAERPSHTSIAAPTGRSPSPSQLVLPFRQYCRFKLPACERLRRQVRQASPSPCRDADAPLRSSPACPRRLPR